eukprot:1157082-Pyramimonas_sp.AAC.1
MESIFGNDREHRYPLNHGIVENPWGNQRSYLLSGYWPSEQSAYLTFKLIAEGQVHTSLDLA